MARCHHLTLIWLSLSLTAAVSAHPVTGTLTTVTPPAQSASS